MTRSELLASIATRIADYRVGEWSPGPTPEHVDTWIKQFDGKVQLPLLSELDHILDELYISKATASGFLSKLAKNKKLAGDTPAAFWRSTGILDIQGGGASQQDMVEEFDQVLQKSFGFGVAGCSPTSGVYVYLDDAVFTGTRLGSDIASWVASPQCPKSATVHVIVMGLHRGGSWHAEQRIEKAATASKKSVDLKFWRGVELEDRRRYINASDVLRPMRLPADPLVAAYAQDLADQGFPVEFRTKATPGSIPVFSSSDSRDLFEQQMLQAGARIRSMCPNLPYSMRPLGFTGLRTLGFGATIVTFRNCPNTCPLAFWVGDPWYPLFPRRTNAEVASDGIDWL